MSGVRLAAAGLRVQQPARREGAASRTHRRQAQSGEDGAWRQDRDGGLRPAPQHRVPARAESGAEARLRDGRDGDRRRRRAPGRPARARPGGADEARLCGQRLTAGAVSTSDGGNTEVTDLKNGATELTEETENYGFPPGRSTGVL